MMERDTPGMNLELGCIWSFAEVVSNWRLVGPVFALQFLRFLSRWAQRKDEQKNKKQQKIKEAPRSDDVLVIPLSFLHCAAPPQSKGGMSSHDGTE